MIDWESFKAQLQTNPKKVVKSVLLLAGCLLLIWILVMLQTGSPTSQNTVQVHKSGQLDGLNLSSSYNTDSLTVKSSSPKVPPVLQNDTTEGFYVLLPMVLIFFIVIGGLWYWIHSKKSPGSGKTTGEVFTTVASQKIPGGQQLLVIKINGEYWVVATGGTHGVSLLHRYSAGEWKVLEQRPDKKDGEKNFWQVMKVAASQKNVQNGWRNV